MFNEQFIIVRLQNITCYIVVLNVSKEHRSKTINIKVIVIHPVLTIVLEFCLHNDGSHFISLFVLMRVYY